MSTPKKERNVKVIVAALSHVSVMSLLSMTPPPPPPPPALFTDEVSSLTLRDLGGQGRRDGDEVVVFAAVVHRHLSAFPHVIRVPVALSHEQVQREAAVQQHSCSVHTHTHLNLNHTSTNTNSL